MKPSRHLLSLWVCLALMGFLLDACRTAPAPATATIAPTVTHTATRQRLPTFTITYTLTPSRTWIPSATQEPTSTPRPTRTQGTPTTPTATHTPSPSPTLDIGRLYEQAIPLCDQALSITSPVTATLENLPLPAFPLAQTDYGSGEWLLPTGLEFIEATAAHEVRSLICIRQGRRADAQYTDTAIGYTLSWTVRLVRWPEGDILAEAAFWGSGPPSQKLDSGPGYGDPPTAALLRWVLCDLNQSASALCQTGGPLAFSPQGDRLIAGVDVWDFPGRQLLHRFSGHRFGLHTLAVSADGQMAASSGVSENTITLWNTATGQPLRQLAGHSAEVYSLAFSPDGQRLASGSLDGNVILWNTANGEVAAAINGVGWVYSLAFSPDGKLLAGGLRAYPGTIYVWNLESGELAQTLRGHEVYVSALAFSPDGSLLASGSVDDTVKVWDVAAGRSLRTLIGHQDDVTTLAFSPDGRFLASGSNDRLVLLWDPGSDELLAAFGGQPGPIEGLAFSPAGTLLAASGGTFVLLHNLPVP